MSERPTTAKPGAARPRRPWRRFRDLPIWSKLGMIMIVPTLATIVVGSSGLVTQIETASEANQTRVLASLSGTVGELVHHLQDERVAAVRLLGADDEELTAETAATYDGVQQAVDEVEGVFQRRSDTVTDVPPSFRDLRDSIYGELARLPQTRQQVASGEVGIISTTGYYENLIASLINLRDLAAQLTTDPELGDRMRAAVAVSQVKEFLSQRRLVGHVVLIRGAYNPYLRTAYIGAGTGLEQARQAFSVVATAEDEEVFAQAEGAEARQSLILQGNLDSHDAGSLSLAGLWDAQEWDETLSAHADVLRQAEQELDGTVVSAADDLRTAAERQLLVQAAVLLTVLLLAIAIAWLVARSMAKSLRALRHGALAVAQHGLPQAVARLRDPALSSQLSPSEVASQIAEPLPVRSRDEFGQVAEAFNAVHLEAVRTAAEQASLRSSVATMFINLARRSQILVDRLISHLDRLERGEEDPDRLAELFQLDHLATRMRRNDENLLVLAGADSTRVQRDPAPLLDVLRAAQSEVEQYTRVEFGVVDRDIEVAAHAVNDLVHLVAELLDNATVFSPPESHVLVEARRVGDRSVLYVEDRGLGLSADQLAEINERLATPPMVDVAVSRMMGLVVVARLAARHGVRVELRPAASGRGTVADVTLPSSVLVPKALTGVPEPPVSTRTSRPEPAGYPQLALPPGRDGDRFPEPRSLPPMAPYPGPQAPAGSPSTGAPASSYPGFVPSPPGAAGGTGGTGGTAGSRGLPAWSDLVGSAGATAAAAPSGNNGSHSGHQAAAYPAGPDAGSGPPPLPRRRPDQAGSAAGPPAAPPSAPPAGPPAASPAGPTALPPAGPTAVPPAPYRPEGAPPPDRSLPWLPPPDRTPPPHRRDTPVTGVPQIPRQQLPGHRPVDPGGSPPAAMPPWPPVPPASPAPAASPEPTAAPEPAQPPPAPPGGAPGGATPSGQPADGPPAGRPLLPADRSGPPAAPYTPPPPPVTPVADQTMELPIFRELESVWFRTRREAQPTGHGAGQGAQAAPGADAAASAPGATTAYASVSAGSVASLDRPGGAGEAEAVREAVAQDTTAEAGDSWQTAADDGWRAASTAAEATVEETTSAGLPKRRPMAQLVPGGVEGSPQRRETPAAATQRRSPEQVRGLLSAYHRGVQRGRGQATEDGTSGSDRSPSTRAGKEQQT